MINKKLQKKYLKKCLITLFCCLIIFAAIFVIGGSITPYNIREAILVKIAAYGLSGLIFSCILLFTYNWVAIFSTWLIVIWLSCLPIIGFLPAIIMALCFKTIYSKILQTEKNNSKLKKATQNSKLTQYIQKLTKKYSEED